MQSSKILVIDNFDSFTYNLVHYLEEFTGQVEVVRNDSLRELNADRYDGIVISPGPGLPEEAGELMWFLSGLIKKKPILGVCLGMQAIIRFFNGKLVNVPEVHHGQQTLCFLERENPLFYQVPGQFLVGRYHSWTGDKQVPDCLDVLARSEDGFPMAIQHRELPVWGVQFHPESVMTGHGKRIIENFLAGLR